MRKIKLHLFSVNDFLSESINFVENYKEKLGRNDKCWCNSGLKYKKCHLDRDRETPVSKAEALKFSKSNSQRKGCYAPASMHKDCDKRIVQAHTLSKSSSLKAIADPSNHVMGVVMNLPSLMRNNGRCVPEKIGINQASTFTGFCAVHDRILFSCLENEKFTGTDEQCFALMFRSLSKEIYAKEGGVRSSDFAKNADKGKLQAEQFYIQKFVSLHQSGLKAAMIELNNLKASLDRMQLSRQFSEIESVIFTFSEPLPIAVSSILSPERDFDGAQIQDLSDLTVSAEQVCFNAFSGEGKGYVVFSWLRTSGIIRRFVQSLIKVPADRIFNTLLYFFFTKAENTYSSPEWWDSLSDKQRENIGNMIMSGVEFFGDPISRVDYSVDYKTVSLAEIRCSNSEIFS
ncbi:SEC-C domain-containing protein [Escherichia coli]|nr:SEC-C domain-containing protein [Escherichia coli]QMJ27532.1 SEC-C domain-containing protein [Escherichia coli]QMJ45979.1 SEC-C domain-containing protein [Escherichia coli]QMJ60616.1 SEC-C domain-containing protein [Escherichia coli]